MAYDSGQHTDDEFRKCVFCGEVFGFRASECPAYQKALADDAADRMHENQNCWCAPLVISRVIAQRAKDILA